MRRRFSQRGPAVSAAGALVSLLLASACAAPTDSPDTSGRVNGQQAAAAASQSVHCPAQAPDIVPRLAGHTTLLDPALGKVTRVIVCQYIPETPTEVRKGNMWTSTAPQVVDHVDELLRTVTTLPRLETSRIVCPAVLGPLYRIRLVDTHGGASELVLKPTCGLVFTKTAVRRGSEEVLEALDRD